MDEHGPWVASVIYVFDDDLNIYWISLPNARHSQAIAKNEKAAGAILASHETGKERGLQIEGTATVLTGSSLEREQALEKKRGMALPSQPGETLKEGQQWYKLAPTRIELIDNELFRYERKRFL
jgi:uncharacterized protein YhbP (UPF0306 family)